jgi:hypothetical protein
VEPEGGVEGVVVVGDPPVGEVDGGGPVVRLVLDEAVVGRLLLPRVVVQDAVDAQAARGAVLTAAKPRTVSSVSLVDNPLFFNILSLPTRLTFGRLSKNTALGSAVRRRGRGGGLPEIVITRRRSFHAAIGATPAAWSR